MYDDDSHGINGVATGPQSYDEYTGKTCAPNETVVENDHALCCEFVPSVIFCPRQEGGRKRKTPYANSLAVVNRYTHIPCLPFKLSPYILLLFYCVRVD